MYVLCITPLLRAGLLRRGHEREPGDGSRAYGGDAGLARQRFPGPPPPALREERRGRCGYPEAAREHRRGLAAVVVAGP